jgi:tRNA modification GTPase
MRHSDIIAAIATAWGESAIAALRVSGTGAVALADIFFYGKRPLYLVPARYMTLGTIKDLKGNVVDQVLAVRFEEGRSYTGEESFEIHCHGGITAVQQCLDLLLAAGARLAEPGEFTKRAFLSGRIDLTQAEAVQSVIRSKSDASLLSAQRSLHGELSSRLREIQNSLTAFRAGLEARLDYPEELDGQDNGELFSGISEIADAARELAERCRVGVMLSSGLKVAIVGRPNVGKSALMNALIGERRAIVTEIPGTTRDTVTASSVWRGLAMEFIDTAGIRETEDEIEIIGISRSREAMRGADIRVVVLDSSRGITSADRGIIFESVGESEPTESSGLPNQPDSSGKIPALLALNKCDLPDALNLDALTLSETQKINRIKRIKTSALTGEGISTMKDAIFELALGSASVEEGYAATERITSAIREAAIRMDEARDALYRSAGVDVAGSLLAEASETISSQLGVNATEELMNAIFSTFCVGK